MAESGGWPRGGRHAKQSKYFKFDGVRLPPFCRGKMEEIANFSLRSSELWIVMYPKSELI
uniref:Uncharacterized protein n=1 Tax=Oncorhynchus mykiss TaxID=8022 RepID=A0A8C7TK71_ONCMY